MELKIGQIYKDKDLGYLQYVGKWKIDIHPKNEAEKGIRGSTIFKTLGKYPRMIHLTKTDLESLNEYSGKAIYTLTRTLDKINVHITKNKKICKTK